MDRQEQWGRNYATRVWSGPPMRVVSDTGIAAANGDVRPGYGSLRDAVAHGEIGHLWCVEQSRLERQEIVWFVLAAELAEAGIGEVHTDRDGIVGWVTTPPASRPCSPPVKFVGFAAG